jgi:hypothetical protein
MHLSGLQATREAGAHARETQWLGFGADGLRLRGLQAALDAGPGLEADPEKAKIDIRSQVR